VESFHQLLQGRAVLKVILTRDTFFTVNLSYLEFVGFGIHLNCLKLPGKSITPKLTSTADSEVRERFLHTYILPSAEKF
jgi:hypothetical protein